MFLLEHPEWVNKMREPGYDFVRKHYSWDKAVEMTYNVYKQYDALTRNTTRG